MPNAECPVPNAECPAPSAQRLVPRACYHPAMDTGELRRQILHALDAARRDSVERRRTVDDATQAYQKFLSDVAAPLVKQAAGVLCAEKQRFVADTPAGSVRLSAEGAPHTFLEFQLDTTGARPHVIGRVSITRRREGVVVEERPIVPNKAVADLVEDDVARFLVSEIPKLLAR